MYRVIITVLIAMVLKVTIINACNSYYDSCSAIADFLELKMLTNGKIYYFSTGTLELTWEEANEFCITNGMKLATIKNYDEFNTVNGYANYLSTKPGSVVLLSTSSTLVPHWVSVNDIEVEGNYVWADPNVKHFKLIIGNDKTRNCGTVNIQILNIQMDNCNSTYPFICEVDKSCRKNVDYKRVGHWKTNMNPSSEIINE